MTGWTPGSYREFFKFRFDKFRRMLIVETIDDCVVVVVVVVNGL